MNKAKPTLCEECGVPFPSKTKYKRHSCVKRDINSIQKDDFDDWERVRYTCKKCGRSFLYHPDSDFPFEYRIAGLRYYADDHCYQGYRIDNSDQRDDECLITDKFCNRCAERHEKEFHGRFIGI